MRYVVAILVSLFYLQAAAFEQQESAAGSSSSTAADIEPFDASHPGHFRHDAVLVQETLRPGRRWPGRTLPGPCAAGEAGQGLSATCPLGTAGASGEFSRGWDADLNVDETEALNAWYVLLALKTRWNLGPVVRGAQGGPPVPGHL